MRFCITFLLFIFSLSAFSQRPAREKLVQFSGIITDVDSTTVIPYATITNLTNSKRQYAADYRGYFSFVVNPGDSILFSAIGYKSFRTTIPIINPDSKYTAMVKLKSEVINLPTVRIFPWATTEEFTREFLALKLADDDMAIAKKNLSRESIKGLIVSLPRDGGEIASQNYRYNYDRMMNKNMVPTYNILNPLAWATFMNQILQGDKSRSSN